MVSRKVQQITKEELGAMMWDDQKATLFAQTDAALAKEQDIIDHEWEREMWGEENRVAVPEAQEHSIEEDENKHLDAKAS